MHLSASNFQPVALTNPPPAPQAGELHLYLADLKSFDPTTLLPTLTDDERARADRYRYPEDRNRYVTTRGLLRTLLAAYLSTPPQSVPLHQQPKGKPFLHPNPKQLHFNLSHAATTALFGFTNGHEIGVDLESPRAAAPSQLDRLIASQLTPTEATSLRAHPSDQHPALFLKHWTCKEALAKALGQGLSLPLNQIELSFASSDPQVLAPATFRGWTLLTLDADANPGAVASPRPFTAIHAWRLH